MHFSNLLGLIPLLALGPLALGAVIRSDGFERLDRYHYNLTAREGSGGLNIPVHRIYGVNIGAWFVFEPYMAVDEWHSMGGDYLCSPCQNCVNDEYRLTKKLGQAAANAAFQKHWGSWITKNDVNLMKQYGINSVRIPLGFWIIEETVNSNEYYPQGGLEYLRRGCKMFNDAGISVLLDMHAAPGAQTASNSFAGRCTSTPHFWESGSSGSTGLSNFDRMNAAIRKLVNYVHTDPANFGSVFAIEALNEPPTDGNATPGYGDFLRSFVNTVRDEERNLGVSSDKALSTSFMDVSWQWQNNQINPADVTNGAHFYDTHLYYNFGAPCGPNGCVQANQDSHVQFACSGGGGRVSSDANQRNAPLVLGEWWLQALGGVASTTDKAFYQRFGDAQKLGYAGENSGGRGWYFWSWKMTNNDNDGMNHLRSYKDAVAQGYLTSTASSYFNANTC